MKSLKRGFTLVELVVVATILVILTGIGFYSYVGNLQDSRDAARQADIAKLSSALKLQHQKRGTYPNPWQSVEHQLLWTWAVIQWFLDSSVALTTLDKLSIDPKLKTPYVYSITRNRQEFQVAGTLENGDNPQAILEWNYKTVAVDILPTIVVASESSINLGTTNNAFVFNGWQENLVYTFTWDNGPVDGSTDLPGLLSDPLIDLWQNSDYRTCLEIKEAWKSIGNTDYQIRDLNWALTTVTCNMDSL